MSQNYMIPGSIVVAGALIAAGVFFSGSTSVPGAHSGEVNVAHAAEREESGNVFGDLDAPVTIVEFSDYECPFCSRLHPTLERIVNESDGNIKWEYRHLPIPSHRNAEEASLSAECVADTEGNDAFWSFTDAIFKNQRSVNTAFFEAEAVALGADLDSFRECVANKDFASVVNDDIAAARAHGGSGTPFSVIVYADGTTKSVSGALPYENWIALLGN